MRPAVSGETEWVPLAHLIGRTLPGESRPVKLVGWSDWWKRWFDDSGRDVVIRDDGCVEVQVEP